MRYRNWFLLVFVLMMTNQMLQSQECKPLNYNVYDDWKDVSGIKISDDGKYVCWIWNPQVGDGKLLLFSTESKRYDTISRGYDADFFPDGKGLIYKIKPPYDSLRKQQLAGIKKEKLMKDSLGVRFFNKDTTLKFTDVKEYKSAGKEGTLLAILHEENYQPPKDTTVTDTTKSKKADKKKPAKKKSTTAHFKVVDLDKLQVSSFEKVASFALSDYNNGLLWIEQKGDSIDSTYVMRYNNEPMNHTVVFSAAGQALQPVFDSHGQQLAFLFTSDTSSRKVYKMAFMNRKDVNATIILDTVSSFFPASLSVSENFKPQFAEDGTALYFGLAPKPEYRSKDTLTADEKVSLDIWNWMDGRIQPQQLKELEKDRKRSQTAVYYPDKGNFVQLSDNQFFDIRLDPKLHRKYLIGIDPVPYEKYSSWEQARYNDVYIVDRTTGQKKLLLGKQSSFFSLSPSMDYLLYYSLADSSWYSLNIKNLYRTKITNNAMDVFYSLENDVPNEAGPYGFAGWINENEAVVYSRNHLWRLDITGKKVAVKMTQLPEGKDVSFRYLNLDMDEFYLPERLYLSAFNHDLKSSGFAVLDIKSGDLKMLLVEPARMSGLAKAKKADVFVFRKETYQQYPDLHLTQDDFIHTTQISHANPQQKSYCWGDVKLVDWISFNGDSLEGLLYYPANFSKDSTYPMIVYFYETHSEDLYRHISPRPSRSTINISDYTSRGYFVFTPDIKYRSPLPGQSAYDAIISGTQSMLERVKHIDATRMGLQGQSWGGYQTAWLVTRTNLFKAAMAGAPVSNMTSAYGGIRWESGMVRAFQYEEGQSRIGASLWENQQAYIENSPLFYADRVATPLLIMSNDNDGAVPWYQGIEFFNALRRLDKPVWMLVYNNAPHNLTRRADSMDLTKRMQQFFDYYLNGAPCPEWMKIGVPAIDKGKKTGF